MKNRLFFILVPSIKLRFPAHTYFSTSHKLKITPKNKTKHKRKKEKNNNRFELLPNRREKCEFCKTFSTRNWFSKICLYLFRIFPLEFRKYLF